MSDDTEKLYQAVQEYIENKDGKVIVIGGIELQQFPQDNKFVYKLAIKFTGKPPQGFDNSV